MTNGVFVPPGKQTFYTPGTTEPLAGGFVYHYIPSTSTPKDTWQDQAEVSLNTNPIELDGNGQCKIWGNGLYRQVLRYPNGDLIWDQVTGFQIDGVPIFVVTTAGPQTVALPADPDEGDEYIVKDGRGTAFTANITVTASPNTIDGQSTFVMDANWQSITAVFSGGDWYIT